MFWAQPGHRASIPSPMTFKCHVGSKHAYATWVQNMHMPRGAYECFHSEVVLLLSLPFGQRLYFNKRAPRDVLPNAWEYHRVRVPSRDQISVSCAVVPLTLLCCRLLI